MKFPTVRDALGHGSIRSSTAHSEESESDTKSDRPSIDDLESLQLSPSYFHREESLTDANDSVAAPNNDNITSNDKLTTTTTTKEKNVLIYLMRHEKAEHKRLGINGRRKTLGWKPMLRIPRLQQGRQESIERRPVERA